MKCRIDSAELVMTERHSIEVDYCPKRRGGWLDRGEQHHRALRCGLAAALLSPASAGGSAAASS